VAAAVLLVAWAIAAAIVDSPTLPSPASVWSALTSNLTGENGLLAAAVGSVWRLALALAFSIVVGTLIGIAMAASRFVQRSLGTVMTGLQALPPIAWFPLAILWFSFTERAVIFVVVIGAIPAGGPCRAPPPAPRPPPPPPPPPPPFARFHPSSFARDGRWALAGGRSTGPS
jgi:NitT/TauT family transport system permease protein